jgi:hypothetical protein
MSSVNADDEAFDMFYAKPEHAAELAARKARRAVAATAHGAPTTAIEAKRPLLMPKSNTTQYNLAHTGDSDEEFDRAWAAAARESYYERKAREEATRKARADTRADTRAALRAAGQAASDTTSSDSEESVGAPANIGVFVEASGVGAAFLSGEADVVAPDDIARILAKHAPLSAPARANTLLDRFAPDADCVQSLFWMGRERIASETSCQTLRKILDDAYAAAPQNDLKLEFDGVMPDVQVILRRTVGTGLTIPFHVDASLETMQVPLASDEPGCGGELVFVGPAGLVRARRAAGVPIFHDATAVHGVTALVPGAPRYGLYVLHK